MKIESIANKGFVKFKTTLPKHKVWDFVYKWLYKNNYVVWLNVDLELYKEKGNMIFELTYYEDFVKNIDIVSPIIKALEELENKEK